MTTGIKTLIRTSTRNILGLALVNGPLVADGEIDATKPEALIYEFSHGAHASWASSSSWTRRPGSRITEARRCSRARAFSSWTARTATAYRLRSSIGHMACNHGAFSPTCAAGLSGAPRITRPA